MSLILALCLLQESDLEELTQKIKDAPDNASLRMDRARLFFRLKRYEESLKDLGEAIRINPKLTDAYVMRGQVLMGLGRKDEAFESWDQALKLDPNLAKTIEDMKKPPRRREDDEVARLEQKLKDPNLSEEERDEIRRQLEEMKRRRPGRDHDREHPDRPLSREEVDEARKWLQENEPEQARFLEEMLASEPMRARGMVQDVLRRKAEMEEMKQRDPEGYAKFQKMRELERKCNELVAEIRKGGHGKDELRKQLSDVLSQLFDLREEQRAKELADLKRRVEELEKILQKRKESRASIIERRLKEMLGEKSDEDW